MHKYKPVTPSYPPRKSVDSAGRTHGRTDEHRISEASYTKSPFGAIMSLTQARLGLAGSGPEKSQHTPAVGIGSHKHNIRLQNILETHSTGLCASTI